MRKTIGFATITLHVKHYTNEEGEHIDIKQTLTGGIEGNQEDRTLDWKERAIDDKIFGYCRASPCYIILTRVFITYAAYVAGSKSKRVKVEEIGNEFLKTGWLPDTVEHGAIYSHVVSDTPKSGREWSAEQVEALACLVAPPQTDVRLVRFGVFRKLTGKGGMSGVCTLQQERRLFSLNSSMITVGF